jgi:hypothetical protein
MVSDQRTALPPSTLNPALDPALWGNGDSGRDRQERIPPPPNPTKTELSGHLSGMAATLAQVDPASSERLEQLASAMSTTEGRASWAEVDLRRAFHTDRLAHAYAVRREGGYASNVIAMADRVRNVLVLVPIFLTWFALAEASRAYARYIELNPEAISQPFLLLWENHFGGEASPFAPTFSAVALLDALLLGIIIALTFFAHGKRDDRDDQIDRTALAFQADLDNMLASASVTLAQDRAAQPSALASGIERLADRFDRGSQELLTRLRVEHDRLEQLAVRREREFSDFGVFASGMRAGAEETHKLLVELRSVSSGLQTALDDLTSEVGVSTDQGRTLLSAIQGLERLTVNDLQSDQALTRQIANAAEVLAEAADRAIAGADSAAQAARVATEASRGIGEIAQGLARSQGRVEAAIAGEGESVARLADALRGGAGGVQASTRALQEIEASLVSIRDGFALTAAQTAEQTRALHALLADQETIAAQLAEVARDLGSISIASVQRQDLAGRDLSALIARLDALTGALSRPAALREPESERRDPTDSWPRRRDPS